jgi:type IV pilus assembly protein PilC
MERRPQIFDPMFRAMVRSGESSGRLDEALGRVAYQLEKLDALKRQIRSAMMYPAFVFGLAIVVLLVVVAFIVPVFAGVFKEVVAEQPGESSQLPLLTRIVMGFSNVITGYWFLWIPLSVGAGIGFLQWKKTEWGRPQWDTIKLKIPFHIGDVIQKAALARWSRTFSGTVASGVPILQSIKITGQTSGNALIAGSMDQVYESVRAGGTIAHPVEKSDLYPPMVGHMITVGEETGQLEQMLSKIADFYEAEVDAKIKALTSLLEPLMIVFVGGMVGLIVIAMYLPIFQIYDKVR